MGQVVPILLIAALCNHICEHAVFVPRRPIKKTTLGSRLGSKSVAKAPPGAGERPEKARRKSEDAALKGQVKGRCGAGGSKLADLNALQPDL